MRQMIISLFLLVGQTSFAQSSLEAVETEFKGFAKNISYEDARSLPVLNNGRIKPFDSLARETVLFLTGKYSLFGLPAPQLYLGLSAFQKAPDLPFIEVRDPKLRLELGLIKDRRRFSVRELGGSNLQTLAGPIFQKQEQNEKSLTPYEKNVLESFHQFVVAQQVMSGEHLISSLDFGLAIGAGQHGQGSANTALLQSAQEFLGSITLPPAGQIEKLKAAVLAQDLAQHGGSLDKVELEVFYNSARPFWWSAWLYILLGIGFLLAARRNFAQPKLLAVALSVPIALHVGGMVIRVLITGFAPVTNMYGTMIWVALGVILFSTLLVVFYRQLTLVGILSVMVGGMLLFTESVPLVLSPDLDPIVAVLRSNLWLTIHVLTITISYAAFTIAMLIGNVALVRTLFGKHSAAFNAEYSHYAYRMIQLGVFLLTVGIILGGIWADYSWGRFWGWDPKETWALIADLGFLAILHARYVGWVGPFGVLASAPVAYLLVIMAWYGVNFVLAAGLHSYGFSSGGTTFVIVFLLVQGAILVGALVNYFILGRQKSGTTKTTTN